MIAIKNVFSKIKKRELELALLLEISSFTNETGLIVSEIHYHALAHTAATGEIDGYDPVLKITAIAP